MIRGHVLSLDHPGRASAQLPPVDDAVPDHALRRHDAHIHDLRRCFKRYLARYTHRIAISNRRLIRLENGAVTFTCKDYRRDRTERYATMTLDVAEFIRRFLMHVLPKGFHRIRHYGLFANANRAANIRRLRELLGRLPPADTSEGEATQDPDAQRQRIQPCPCYGGPMIVIEVFEAGCQPKYRPPPEVIDSS